MAAGMTVAGADERAAVDFAQTSSSARASASDLRHLSRSALLWNDLRGDLMMLAEDLGPDATRALLRSLADVAATSNQPALAFDFVDHCTELLGAR